MTIYGHKKNMCFEQNISIQSFHATFASSDQTVLPLLLSGISLRSDCKFHIFIFLFLFEDHAKNTESLRPSNAANFLDHKVNVSNEGRYLPLLTGLF